MTSENCNIDLTNSFTNIIEIEDSIIISPVQKRKNDRTTNSLTPEQNKVIFLSSLPTCTRGLPKQKEKHCGIGICPICWEDLGTNPLASTKCGHVYCLKCLESYVRKEKKCPTCRCQLKGSSAYHPLYLNLQ